MITLVVSMAAVGLIGFILWANLSDVDRRPHPEGWRGGIRDAVVPVLPIIPLALSLSVRSWLMRAGEWIWLAVWAVTVLCMVLGSMSPPVRRARERLVALVKRSAQ